MPAWLRALRSRRPYKVVFDLTSADQVDQRAVLRWLKEVSSVNEIVAKQRAGWGYFKVGH